MYVFIAMVTSTRYTDQYITFYQSHNVDPGLVVFAAADGVSEVDAPTAPAISLLSALSQDMMAGDFLASYRCPGASSKMSSLLYHTQCHVRQQQQNKTTIISKFQFKWAGQLQEKPHHKHVPGLHSLVASGL